MYEYGGHRIGMYNYMMKDLESIGKLLHVQACERRTLITHVKARGLGSCSSNKRELVCNCERK